MSGLLTGMALKTDLKANRKLVLISLTDHAKDDGTDIFPSIEYTSKRASCSRSTTKRVISELRELGLLIVVNEARAQFPTEYKLNVRLLRKMVSHNFKEDIEGVQIEPGSELEPAGGSELEPAGGSELEPLNVIETLDETLESTREEEISNPEEKSVGKEKKDPPSKTKKFVKPTLSEITEYFVENGVPEIEAHKFLNHYESNGWMVGRNKMKSWRSAAGGWKLRIDQFSGNGTTEKSVSIGDNSDAGYSEWAQKQTRLNV